MSKVTPSEPGAVDLIGVQHQDLELNKLAQSCQHRDWYVWQEPSGLILARKGEELPVWVVPQQLRTDVISLEHDQGHFGTEKTTQQVESFGWWPSLREDVSVFCQQLLALCNQ